MALILMGVSGTGKTTVGRALARVLGWAFIEGDDHHPPENIAKMGSGVPLDDADRAAWLAALHDLIHEYLRNGNPLVVTCSALKQKYRDQLLAGNPGAVFVHLQGSYELILDRMRARREHFMKSELLRSQFEALENPVGVVTVGIDQPVERVVDKIIARTGVRENRGA